MALTKSKLYAINAVVFGLMVLSYFFPALRYFIFIPLLLTSVLQLYGLSRPDVKLNKVTVMNGIVVSFSVVAYSVGLFCKDKILYVCAAVAVFSGITFLISKALNLPTEPLDDNEEIQ